MESIHIARSMYSTVVRGLHIQNNQLRAHLYKIDFTLHFCNLQELGQAHSAEVRKGISLISHVYDTPESLVDTPLLSLLTFAGAARDLSFLFARSAPFNLVSPVKENWKKRPPPY